MADRMSPCLRICARVTQGSPRGKGLPAVPRRRRRRRRAGLAAHAEPITRRCCSTAGRARSQPTVSMATRRAAQCVSLRLARQHWLRLGVLGSAGGRRVLSPPDRRPRFGGPAGWPPQRHPPIACAPAPRRRPRTSLESRPASAGAGSAVARGSGGAGAAGAREGRPGTNRAAPAAGALSARPAASGGEGAPSRPPTAGAAGAGSTRSGRRRARDPSTRWRSVRSGLQLAASAATAS